MRLEQLVKKIDFLRSLNTPSREDVLVFQQYIRTPAAAGYFFRDEFKNFSWLGPLVREDIFRKYSDLRSRGRSKQIVFRELSAYLSRIADKVPNEVAEVIESLETKDSWVIGRLLDAILKMPPQVIAQLIATAEMWVVKQAPYAIAHYMEKLLERLLEGQEKDAALRLLKILLTPHRGEKPGEVSGIIDESDLQEILRGTFRQLLQICPSEALAISEKALKASLKISEERCGREKSGDASIVWYPAIERDEDRYPLFESVLVESVRDALLSLCEYSNSEASNVIQRYLRNPRPIFRRIALHALREKYNSFIGLARKTTLSMPLLYNYYSRHEYSLLLSVVYDNLTEKQKNRILKLIIYPNDPESDIGRSTVTKMVLPTLRDKTLPPWTSEALKKIEDEFGPFSEEIFPAGRVQAWFGTRSPFAVGELNQKEPHEVIKELRSFKPPKERTFPPEPSHEGLGGAFRQIVAKTPERFLPLSEDIRNLRPVYIFNFLSGISDAVQRNHECDWASIWPELLSFIGTLIPDTPPDKWPDAGIHPEPTFDFEPNMLSVRKISLDLIIEGIFKDGSAKIPVATLLSVKEIAIKLSKDIDPSLDEENKHELDQAQIGGAKTDWATMAFNVARGRALELIIRYTIRHANAILAQTGKRAMSFEPEIEMALNRLLRDNCRSVRSVFGFWLETIFVLDRKWLESNLIKIFPKETSQVEIYQATWNAFLRFSRLNEPLFRLLEDNYRQDIDKVASITEILKERDNPVLPLAKHLSATYAWGWIRLDSSDNLLNYFYDRASDNSSAAFADALSKLLSEHREETWERFEYLLGHRTHIAKTDSGNHKRELHEFASWFRSLPFGGHGILPEMMNALLTIVSNPLAPFSSSDILDYLQKQAPEYPNNAILVLDKMLRKCDKEVLAWKDDKINTVLKTVFENGDDSTRNKARRLIQHLWKRGFWLFFEHNRLWFEVD
jgi:hypothetical protein